MFHVCVIYHFRMLYRLVYGGAVYHLRTKGSDCGFRNSIQDRITEFHNISSYLEIQHKIENQLNESKVIKTIVNNKTMIMRMNSKTVVYSLFPCML